MKNSLEALVQSSQNAIKYWWLALLVGVAVFVMGIVVFTYPAASYIVLSVAFGWLILFSGLSQVILSLTGKHFITGRGWMLFGGIIESILGLILILSPAISAATIPFFLGFWLLFRSFAMIGLVGDMNLMSISGGGWTMLTAVLLMIAAFMILVQPLFFGVEAVVIWIGVSFLVAGISMSVFAVKLRGAHKF